MLGGEVGLALSGVLGGDTDLVDTGDGEADLSDLVGELVTLGAPDEIQCPPRNKASVFLPATQCVSKRWFKCSITLALR